MPSLSVVYNRHHRPTPLPPVTITLTEIVATTIDIPTFTSTSSTSDSGGIADIPPPVDAHHIHRLLPVLAVFAVIGLLTVLGLLGYLGYRFFQSGRKDHHQPLDFENSARELRAHYAAKQQQQQQSSFLSRLFHSPSSRPPQQQEEKEEPLENADQPISPTFVPMSPIRLVPRMEIWQDPERRRGIDEVAMWENKRQRRERQPVYRFHDDDYPTSPRVMMAQEEEEESPTETISPSSSSAAAKPQQATSHVAMARDTLQASRLENSSSQWLRGSSQSL